MSGSAPSSGQSGIMRSESMAYAAPSSDLWSRVQYILRYNARAVAATSAFLAFVFVLSSDWMRPYPGGGIRGSSFDHWGGAIHPGYFLAQDAVIDPNSFRFAVVTDLDQLSRISDSSKPKFRSTLLPGVLKRDTVTGKYTVEFEPTRQLVSKHNEAGRGMELSELTLYRNRLLSFDDRTGDVFEILQKPGGQESYVVPRFVITEGDGDTDKGMKWEWATVKDDELYLGSMGKEYTNQDGSVANTNNLWIAVLNARGEMRRVDWVRQFNFVREALGAASPGYTINEAILWSDHLNKWVFLPRRISAEMYDENKDERKGSNKLALVDERFTEATVVDIKMREVDPLHGFSTFAFVPGTGDTHALAIRSVEEDCVDGTEMCKQRSYIMAFDVLTGEVLMEEVKIEMDEKFEGIEFVNMYTEPKYQ